MHYTILVPLCDSSIRAGSGIVCDLSGVDNGSENDTKNYRVYFEGNLYGAVNLKTIEDRLLVAALRLRDRAPTVAWQSVPSNELLKRFVAVGVFDLERRRAIIDADAANIWNAWLSAGTASEGSL